MSDDSQVFARYLSQMFAQAGITKARPATLGKGDGVTVYVPTDKSEAPGQSLVYVHEDQQTDIDTPARRTVSTAFNPEGYGQHGLPIMVGAIQGSEQRVIISIDYKRYPAFAAATGTRGIDNQHGPNHYVWGPGGGKLADPVYIDNAQIVNLSVAPTATTPDLFVQIVGTANRSVFFSEDGDPQVWTNNTPLELTSYLPATPGNAKWVLIQLDREIATGAGALSVVDGVEFVQTVASPFPHITDLIVANMPSREMGKVGLAYIYLYEGQIAVGWQHIRLCENGRASGRNTGQCGIYPNRDTYNDDFVLDDGCNLVLCGPIELAGTIDGRLCII